MIIIVFSDRRGDAGAERAVGCLLRGDILQRLFQIVVQVAIFVIGSRDARDRHRHHGVHVCNEHEARGVKTLQHGTIRARLTQIFRLADIVQHGRRIGCQCCDFAYVASSHATATRADSQRVVSFSKRDIYLVTLNFHATIKYLE